MNAFVVSVNYTDVLRQTLPLQRKFFDRVFIITSSADAPNVSPVAKSNNSEVIVTDLFYADGADFNKWRALEYGLDQGGRKGVICLMDADVVWPAKATVSPQRGKLYTPLRYMYPCVDRVPAEHEWDKYPIHRNVSEWAGYTQIFHADDPVLGPAPWHEVNWRTAGGADSFFQRKWRKEDKLRPAWACLHMGPAGANWAGRVTAYADGSVPPDANDKSRKLREYFRLRNVNRNFSAEKLTGS